MGRTLLVGHPSVTWHDWIKERNRDLVCLDPANADFGPPCRSFFVQDSKVRSWRLIGSTDVSRDPLALASAAWKLVQQADQNADVLLFGVRNSPLVRQTALEIAQCVSPSTVLVPSGTGLARLGWPVGASEIELPKAFPTMVVEAQRRARWIEMLEAAENHEVHLSDVTTMGARLGSGLRVEVPDWEGWAEVCGGVLFLVGDLDPEESRIGRLLDQTHASKLSFVHSTDYGGLLCSFASEEGEDFGIGTISEFDPVRGLLRIKSTAVPPSPVRVLRFGSVKLDAVGRESPVVKPWSL